MRVPERTLAVFETARRHRLAWPVLTLVLLLALNAAFNPSFVHLEWRAGHLYGSLIDILNHAAPLAIVALGMTLVIATRGIDISVGAVVAIAAALAAWMIGGALVVVDGAATHVSRFPMPLAILAAVAAALLCGLWNGVLVARVGMQPIIATLILMVAGRGIAQLITGGQIITIYYEPFFFLGNGHLLGLPFSLFVAAAIFAVLHAMVTRSALGLFIQAVGINPSAARLAGVRARRIVLGVYGFCGACAGVAGLLISSNVKSADGNNAGQLLELDAILAVTLGGTALTGGRFSLLGSVVGALIIQTLTYGIYSLGVPPEINLVVKAVVVFAVMLLQSAEFRKSVRAWVMRSARREVVR
jgi:galactofuranose transport system permease protein